MWVFFHLEIGGYHRSYLFSLFGWLLFVLCVNLIFFNGRFCVFDGFCISNRNRKLNHWTTAAGASNKAKFASKWVKGSQEIADVGDAKAADVKVHNARRLLTLASSWENDDGFIFTKSYKIWYEINARTVKY